mmetsp:Transcript_30978/g.86933  ORF Transcript_30978/g.86933 Transcript_30978/m.86933 type:complete len:230 (+) Transcript_30978:207-896(+)
MRMRPSLPPNATLDPSPGDTSADKHVKLSSEPAQWGPEEATTPPACFGGAPSASRAKTLASPLPALGKEPPATIKEELASREKRAQYSEHAGSCRLPGDRHGKVSRRLPEPKSQSSSCSSSRQLPVNSTLPSAVMSRASPQMCGPKMARTALPARTSQNCTVLSQPPLTIKSLLPSTCKKRRAMTRLQWPAVVKESPPLSREVNALVSSSKTKSSPVRPAVASRRPSGA